MLKFLKNVSLIFHIIFIFFANSYVCFAEDVSISDNQQSELQLPKYNLFISPLTFLVGGTTFGFDRRLTEKLSLGLEFTHYSFATGYYTQSANVSNMSFGLRTIWYPDEIYAEGSFYVSKVLRIVSSMSLLSVGKKKSSHFSESYSLLLGYGNSRKWRDFYFRLSGGGVVSQVSKTNFLSTDEVIEKSYDNWPIGIFMDFNISYIF